MIQKTSTGSACLVNNYGKDNEHPGQYKIEQVSEHFLLGLTSVDHKYHYTGDLTIPDTRSAGKMKVKFPLSKYSITKSMGSEFMQLFIAVNCLVLCE